MKTKIFVNFKNKRLGFYLSLASVVLLVVAMIAYHIGYSSGENIKYYSFNALLIPIIGIGVFAILSLFRKTEKFAAIPLLITSLAGFLIFINTSYMYLSEVFYSGINEQTLQALNKNWVVATVGYLLAFIISNVAIYQKQASENTVDELVEQSGSKIFSKQSSKKFNLVAVLATVFTATISLGVLSIVSFSEDKIDIPTAQKVDPELVIPEENLTIDISESVSKDINATCKEGFSISYSSNNENIAYVDQNGKIIAVDIGETSINVAVKQYGKPKPVEIREVPLTITGPADYYRMLTSTAAKNDAVIANPDTWYLYTTTTSGTRIHYYANENVYVSFIGVDSNKEWYLRYQPTFGKSDNYTAKMTINIDRPCIARFGSVVELVPLLPGDNEIEIQRVMSSSTPFSLTLLDNETVADAQADPKKLSTNFNMVIKNINFYKDLVVTPSNVLIDLNNDNKTVQLEVSDPMSSTATFTYESADTSIATVSNSGLVTGLKEGATTIKITSSTKNFKVIPVTISSHTLSIDKTSLFINADENPNGKITATCDDPSLLTFTSGDPTIATVDKSGNVVGLKHGITTITVACGAVTKTCTVTVVKPSTLPTSYDMETIKSAATAKTDNVVKDPGIWHSYASDHSKLTKSRYENGNINFTLSEANKTVYFRYRPCFDVGASCHVSFNVVMPDSYVYAATDKFEICGTPYTLTSGENSFNSLADFTLTSSNVFQITLKVNCPGDFAISNIVVEGK